MRSWFDWRHRAPDPVTDGDAAVVDGDADRVEIEHEVARREAAERRVASAEWRDAYERGRRDERARRPTFSLVSVAVLMAAIVGGGAVFLAAREGSFTRGGEVVDHTLSTAADKAQAPIRGAADRTGAALEHAGQSLKDKAGSGDQSGK